MKIWSVKYTGDESDPPVPRARPAITVSAGMMRCVQVRAPSEGAVSKLVIKQSGGTPCECIVDLLDSEVPYAAGEQAAGTAPDDDIELYQIIDSQVVNEGDTLKLVHQEFGFPYHNQDGGYANNQRYLYLILQPIGITGAQGPQGVDEETTWDVLLTIVTDIG